MRGFTRVLAGVLAGLACFSGMTGVSFAAGGYGAIAGEQSGGGSSGGGSLPFTGVDLVAYLLVAGAIVAAGVALRSLAGRGSRI